MAYYVMMGEHNRSIIEEFDTESAPDGCVVNQEESQWRYRVFKNLTPHRVNLVFEGRDYVLPHCEDPARVTQMIEKTVGIIGERVFGAVVGLPEYVQGYYYIVPSMVAAACPDRRDLVVPLGDIRDEEGHVQGTTLFVR